MFVTALSYQTRALALQENNDMSELTENLKPRCVGRYLIDMPTEVLVSSGAKVLGVAIDSEAMTHDKYLQGIASRQATLRGKNSMDAYPLLYADDAVDGSNTHYFISRGNLNADPANRVIEAYKWDHGYRYKLEIEGSDFLHPDQTQDSIVKQIAVKNDVPDKTRLVFDLVKRLRWRSDDEIPAEPGLCILGGFLPGKAGDKEKVLMQFVPVGNRDVSFDFESNSGIRESDTLLQRAGQINAGLTLLSDRRTIRKGKVKLPGIDAEEWLIVGKTDLGVVGSMFTLEGNSMTGGAQTPLIMLDFQTASPNFFMKERFTTSSLNKSEAVALWDTVSRTLRPRPNGF